MKRRTVLWSAPVVALAVAAPQAAASNTNTTCSDGNGGYYTVGDKFISVHYSTPPDIYEINVHYADGSSQSFGTNYGNAPVRGSVDWTVPVREKPSWVQVHNFDSHWGESSCPAS